MRSAWKGIPVFKSIYLKFKTVKKLNLTRKKVLSIGYFRNAKNYTILSDFVGQFVNIHNGKKFEKIVITEEMVGFKLGDFVICKKTPVFFDKKKKKNVNKWVV